MAWSPLGGGALFDEVNKPLLAILEEKGQAAGVDAVAVAIAWLLAHPSRIMPVLGTNNIARIAKISDALAVAVDRQAWFEIYQAANGREVP